MKMGMEREWEWENGNGNGNGKMGMGMGKWEWEWEWENGNGNGNGKMGMACDVADLARVRIDLRVFHPPSERVFHRSSPPPAAKPRLGEGNPRLPGRAPDRR